MVESKSTSLEESIADAKANPRPLDAGLLDGLSCAAVMLEQGCDPMPYYAQDLRTAIEFIRERLSAPGIPVYRTNGDT